MSTTLSVICPITDASKQIKSLERWLEDCAFHAIHVIIVHDFRDKATAEALASLCNKKKALDMDYIEGVFGTAGLARNAGLGFVKGEWMCFWDFDDYPRVAQVIEAIQDNRTADLIIGQFIVAPWNDNQITNKLVAHYSNGVRDLIVDPGIWRCLFRSAIFKDMSFPEIAVAEDQFYLSQVHWSSLNVSFDSRVLYEYRYGRPGQTTNNRQLIEQLRLSIEYLEQTLDRDPKVSFELIAGMIFRQSLTLFRSSRIVDKLYGLKSLVSISFSLLKRRSLFQLLPYISRKSFRTQIRNH